MQELCLYSWCTAALTVKFAPCYAFVSKHIHHLLFFNGLTEPAYFVISRCMKCISWLTVVVAPWLIKGRGTEITFNGFKNAINILLEWEDLEISIRECRWSAWPSTQTASLRSFSLLLEAIRNTSQTAAHFVMFKVFQWVTYILTTGALHMLDNKRVIGNNSSPSTLQQKLLCPRMAYLPLARMTVVNLNRARMRLPMPTIPHSSCLFRKFITWTLKNEDHSKVARYILESSYKSSLKDGEGSKMLRMLHYYVSYNKYFLLERENLNIVMAHTSEACSCSQV